MGADAASGGAASDLVNDSYGPVGLALLNGAEFAWMTAAFISEILMGASAAGVALRYSTLSRDGKWSWITLVYKGERIFGIDKHNVMGIAGKMEFWHFHIPRWGMDHMPINPFNRKLNWIWKQWFNSRFKNTLDPFPMPLPPLEPENS
jgi:hypothetical protein